MLAYLFLLYFFLFTLWKCLFLMWRLDRWKKKNSKMYIVARSCLSGSVVCFSDLTVSLPWRKICCTKDIFYEKRILYLKNTLHITKLREPQPCYGVQNHAKFDSVLSRTLSVIMWCSSYQQAYRKLTLAVSLCAWESCCIVQI